jgi:hypothetical protein
MARPRQKDRSKVANETLTIRLTAHERALLDALVARRRGTLEAEGGKVSAASYVRGLILRVAYAEGLDAPDPTQTPAKRPPKKR